LRTLPDRPPQSSSGTETRLRLQSSRNSRISPAVPTVRRFANRRYLPDLERMRSAGSSEFRNFLHVRFLQIGIEKHFVRGNGSANSPSQYQRQLLRRHARARFLDGDTVGCELSPDRQIPARNDALGEDLSDGFELSRHLVLAD